ncbi:MAG: polyphosphate kinase 1 [Clostridiales bacterium]|nr:polyphosphate kinase 1 [Clostridiales bacterium]
MGNTCYDNRELSWLKFNTRVLEEAEDTGNPFCERLSFASIYQSNLDEFFGVRVGSLYDQMLVSKDIRDNKTNMTCQEQIYAICDQVRLLGLRKDACYADLDKGLEERGVDIATFPEIAPKDARYLDAYFEHEVRPLLAPQVVGRKQPFPFLKNQAIYAVVILGPKKASKAYKSDKLGIVPCSIDVLPRLVRIPDYPNRYMLMEELIIHYLGRIFSHFEVKSKSLIRIVRNADIDPDEEMYDDDTDFRQVMEQLVSRRRRLAPIRLEYANMMDESIIDIICKYLKLKKNYVFPSESPLDLSFFSKISDILRNEKDMFFEKYVQKYPPDLNPRETMMDQIEEKDRFLFYPYESMDPFLKLLNEAAVDPEVVSVKMTLYRVARNSKVVEALIRAAENGKEVSVLVELRARFDEANNIGWSRRLEDAGCSILYGLDELKVHSKICLITRKDGDGVSYITQVGTGNYNEKTARLYTDFCLMSANRDIGEEASEIFTRMYMDEVVEETKHLMVAPKCLRSKILEKVDAQIGLAHAGKPAYVGAKTNSLTDKVIMDKLIEASQAGVKVELVVRGACCLIAGVPGLTENISVRSIVGRYLEHSRIYIFGKEDPEVFISSADFMTRNTTKRVEVAAPVYDSEIRDRVLNIFKILMADNVKARVQMADGSYERMRTDEPPLIAQEYFMKDAGRPEKPEDEGNAGDGSAEAAAEDSEGGGKRPWFKPRMWKKR